jgi:glycosyltransferase involved in cell wall biosynthesis
MSLLSRFVRALRPARAAPHPAVLRSLYARARDAVRALDPSTALPLLDQVLELDPDHAGALESKLLMLDRSGEVEVADSLAEIWLAVPTLNRQMAVARYWLARRRPMEALNILDAISDPDARLTAWKARALFILGRYSEAEVVVEKALAIDAELGVAKRIRADIEAERVSTSRSVVPLPRSSSSFSPRPKRVLHMVTSSLPTTVAGYTIRSQSIGQAQMEIGLEPHFVTKAGFPEYEAAPALEVVDGVPYHRLAPGIGRIPEDRRIELYADLARQVVEDVRPSVLHPATGFPNAVAALSLREVFGIPVVYEVRGFLEDSWVASNVWASDVSDRYRWRRQAEVDCMHAADAIVTLAETMKAEIMSWGISGTKIHVVPNAVDVNRFRPRPRNHALAEAIGIRSDGSTVGYISTMSPYEGVDCLIEAISVLRKRGRRVQGLLVGDGPERAALEVRARELDVAEHVVFAGAVPPDQILDYYSLIDVFVVPRTTDRVARLVTPLKPFEAMAMEIPTVVSDVPALREMVIDGETGLLFRPEDPVDLADKITQMTGDDGPRDRMLLLARRWVAENRSWERSARAYDRIYESVRGRGSD